VKSDSYAALSADGRFVAFHSKATNLVPGDTNGSEDVFVRDRIKGTTERVSLGLGNLQADGRSASQTISANGRFVAFASDAGNLVAGDTNNTWDVFVRDRWARTTQRVSIGPNGAQWPFSSSGPQISADGRFIAFTSDWPLSPGDRNADIDVFVHDRSSGRTETISVTPSGKTGNGQSQSGNITTLSSDGRFVAFASYANDLVPDDTNTKGSTDVFVRDRWKHVTRRISVGRDGAQGNDSSFEPSISADGCRVAFTSNASNLVRGDNDNQSDIFLYDCRTDTIAKVGLGHMGVEPNGSCREPALSADGRVVAFNSDATNMISRDTNGVVDIFVRNLWTSLVRRANLGPESKQSEAIAPGPGGISGAGRIVSFVSEASDLVLDDTNGLSDVFIRVLSP
jgi:Tol biopolymer transport system component